MLFDAMILRKAVMPTYIALARICREIFASFPAYFTLNSDDVAVGLTYAHGRAFTSARVAATVCDAWRMILFSISILRHDGTPITPSRRLRRRRVAQRRVDFRHAAAICAARLSASRAMMPLSLRQYERFSGTRFSDDGYASCACSAISMPGDADSMAFPQPESDFLASARVAHATFIDHSMPTAFAMSIERFSVSRCHCRRSASINNIWPSIISHDYFRQRWYRRGHQQIWYGLIANGRWQAFSAQHRSYEHISARWFRNRQLMLASTMHAEGQEEWLIC